MGTEPDKKEKAMKKQIAKLSKAERDKVEAEYHSMTAADFDKAMVQARRQAPAISRPKRKSKPPEKKRAA